MPVDHTSNSLGFYSRYLSKKFTIANCDDPGVALLEQRGKDGGRVKLADGSMGRSDKARLLSMSPVKRLLACSD
jgi:hypothetical protein